MHLEKSLSNHLKSLDYNDSTLETKIYTAFAHTYEKYNNWQMTCDYYQRALQKCTHDRAPEIVIAKYKKQMQNMIDRINESA